MAEQHEDTCAVAHGAPESPVGDRVLVAIFDSPVASYLLKFGADLGYRTVLTDGPVPELDASADVVVTDHHRAELGSVLRDVLLQQPRWIGVIGNPRHEGPHIQALRDLGVDDDTIKRVHRPIGLNIGSRTPAEIAVSTLAGLIADRNGRSGGFEF